MIHSTSAFEERKALAAAAPASARSPGDAARGHVPLPPPRKEHRGRRWPLRLLVAVCVLCDFGMAPIFVALFERPPGWSAGLGFAVLGCTLAQGCALAAWLAWDTSPFVARLARHWGIAAALCLAWVAGLLLSASRDDYYLVFVNVALAVPLVSLATQFPLWTVRHWFGWRLVQETSEIGLAGDPPLAIRDLMLATVLVAVALAAARMMPVFERDAEAWFGLGAAVLVAGGISAVSMLPAGALMLRRRRLALGLLYSALYAALLIGSVWVVVGIMRWQAPGALAPFFFYYAVSCLMLGFAVTVMLTGSVARAHGYRLVWGRMRCQQNSSVR